MSVGTIPDVVPFFRYGGRPAWSLGFPHIIWRVLYTSTIMWKWGDLCPNIEVKWLQVQAQCDDYHTLKVNTMIPVNNQAV